MLLLMMLRSSHTNMATVFLVRAMEKLSLGAAAAPPSELLLVMRRSTGPEEVEVNISSSLSEGTHLEQFTDVSFRITFKTIIYSI